MCEILEQAQAQRGGIALDSVDASEHSRNLSAQLFLVLCRLLQDRIDVIERLLRFIEEPREGIPIGRQGCKE